MANLREIILAAIALVAFSWHFVYAWRRSTVLSLGLGLVTAGFALELGLNVTAVEQWMQESTGIPALSAVVKNEVFAMVSIGCVLTWGLWGKRRWQWVATSVIVAYMIFALVAWRITAAHCPHYEALKYELCALDDPLAASAKAGGVLLVGACGAITTWFIRPLIGFNSRERRAAGILFVALIFSVLWTAVAALGVLDVYRTGDLSYFQYLVRTPLAAIAAGLAFTAVLYPPAGYIFTAVAFAIRSRGILRRLGVRRTQAIVAGGSANYGVVDVMDALGRYLDEQGVSVRSSSAAEGANEAADILSGNSDAKELTVPVNADADSQRRWLLRVAKLVGRE